MYNMRIKVGEHEGVPEYSTVSLSDIRTVRTKGELEDMMVDGYQVIEFQHPIAQVQRMTPGTVPMFAAFVKSSS